MNKLFANIKLFPVVFLLFCSGVLLAEESTKEKIIAATSAHFKTPVKYSNTLTDLDRPFDVYLKREKEAEKKISKSICRPLKFNKMMDCTTDIWERFVHAGRFRGNNEFVKKNYIPLGVEGLKALLPVLEAQYKKAQAMVDSDNEGELSRSSLNVELGAIVVFLGKVERANFKIECEKIFGKEYKPCAEY